jgi:hypothetical protein
MWSLEELPLSHLVARSFAKTVCILFNISMLQEAAPPFVTMRKTSQWLYPNPNRLYLDHLCRTTLLQDRKQPPSYSRADPSSPGTLAVDVQETET